MLEFETQKQKTCGTSLVAKWLRVCVPVSGMQARYLVRELRFRMLQGSEVQAP